MRTQLIGAQLIDMRMQLIGLFLMLLSPDWPYTLSFTTITSRSRHVVNINDDNSRTMICLNSILI